MTNKYIRILPAVLFSALLIFAGAKAFFDEIALLKQELALWEEVNAEDFSDVIEQLDDITGAVFTDVGDNDWFSPYVSSLTEWGVVSGYKDSDGLSTGEFKPANYVTVAEALKMTIKAADVPEECDLAADSIAGRHWADGFVRCAAKNGSRLFGAQPEISLDRPASRSEVLVMIHDSFKDELAPVYSSFNDTQGHPFEADIASAQIFGIVSGDKSSAGVELGTFRPNDPINRAEAAKIVYQRMKEEAKRELSK
ncbi:TPA: S-layer homology domain-containing protein [Candidatus Micrarchaeota archaeon]|nr:S-layer homology domain-containing protein [Candidatus Micrarchaeota archaeon]